MTAEFIYENLVIFRLKMVIFMKKKVNVRGESRLHPTMHRKVRQNGNSLYITLPKPFCELHQLKVGDVMALIFGESLRIMPVSKGE